MKTLLLLLLAGAASAELRPLRVEGRRLVDDAGRELVLRGVNFGSWLLMETYFMGLPFKDERTLYRRLEARLGRPAMLAAREAYRDHYITAEDFRRVKALGMNHVRVPFWYELLEDDEEPGRIKEEGWKRLDFAVESCEAAGIYCVLDFHGAAGGQSAADHTGESERNQFWKDPKNVSRTADLWRLIAKRYRGRASIAAFDLLNEPMGAPSGEAIVAASDALLRAVREGDPDRVAIVEEGYQGLGIFPDPDKTGWTNVMYSLHFYPTMFAPEPGPQVHERFLAEDFPAIAAEQARLNAPLYMGEWNAIHGGKYGGDAATRKYVEAMDARGWSWAIWTWKQTQPAGVSAEELWSFYRNDQPAALPDFEKDDLPTLLKKLAGLRTENMSLHASMSAAVKARPDRHPAVAGRARPRVDAAAARAATLLRPLP